ncbi:epithelial membrane protein 1 [Mantella aurantiaca]
MLVVLAAVFVVHIATTVMLFVATISNTWLKGVTGVGSRGIWLECTNERCVSILDTYPGDESAMKAVEAFMILAIIFCCFALIAFIAQLFTLGKGYRFYITGALMLFCWLCILIGVSIYTARFANRNVTDFYHAYCFILAWICFCLSFILGILYMVLRKK